MPGERIVFQWRFVEPDRTVDPTHDSLLTITLGDAPDGGTALVLVHERLEGLAGECPTSPATSNRVGRAPSIASPTPSRCTSERFAPTPEVMSREGKGTQAGTDAGDRTPMEWPAVEERFRNGGWFWLATVNADGRPHVVPLFAAWSGSSFFVASKSSARKSHDIAANERCVVTTDTGDLHVVVEGRARRITDEPTLEQASATFRSIYDWPTEVVGDELDAPCGAPTSGGPPYGVYEITPTKSFAFPTDGVSFTPTRWRFDA